MNPSGCCETAADMIFQDYQPIASWADFMEEEEEKAKSTDEELHVESPLCAMADLSQETKDPESPPSVPETEIPPVAQKVCRDGRRFSKNPRPPSKGHHSAPSEGSVGKRQRKREVKVLVPVKVITRNGWKIRMVRQKPAPPPQQENSSQEQEPQVPAEDAAVKKAASTVATKPPVTPAAPSKPSAWGKSAPQVQRSFWATFGPQKEKKEEEKKEDISEDKDKSLVSPAEDAVVPASSQQQTGEQEAVKPPVMPVALPPKESSTVVLDEPEPEFPVQDHPLLQLEDEPEPSPLSRKEKRRMRKNKISSTQMTPTAPASVDSKKRDRKKGPKRIRKHKTASAPPEVVTNPPVSASPPQLESSTQKLDIEDPEISKASVVPAAPPQVQEDALAAPKLSRKAKRRMGKMRKSLQLEIIRQEAHMQELIDAEEAENSIEHLCELFEELHLSSQPLCKMTPPPVAEHQDSGSIMNGAGPFNRLKPLIPAKFTYEFTATFGLGQKQNDASQMKGQGESEEKPDTAAPALSPPPSEVHRSALKDSITSRKAAKKEKKKLRKSKKSFPQREDDAQETIEDLCRLLDKLHLSRKRPAIATPSPVAENPHLADNTRPFNRLKPLQLAKFQIPPSSAERDIEHLCKLFGALHLSTSTPQASHAISPLDAILI